ncbi:CRM family member 2 isoform X2 [Tasmannia lanceolata]|uniref:CRM family member 2 isoform X2 n=1 Tax=Tasmannia lanceolata TaxID=3420 RepID=UPI0040639A83
MLLPLYHHHPSFSFKTLDSFSPPIPPSSPLKTLSFQNPKPLTKSLLRTSSPTSSDAETVSKSAIQRIAEKLRSLGYIEDGKQNPNPNLHTKPLSAGEIFIPTSRELSKHRVGYTIDASWSTPENPVPVPGSGTAIMRFHEVKGELERQKESVGKVKRAAPVPTLAELTIAAEELKRLRSVGIRLEKRLKVGKAGITEGIVNGIHERWRRSELVKIKCEDLCRMNMKRTHETLERKTGGLVVWRSGSIIILYRGTNYVYPYFLSDNTKDEIRSDEVSLSSSNNCGVQGEQEDSSLYKVGMESSIEPVSSNNLSRSSLVFGVGSPQKVRLQLPGEAQLEEEADLLLDGLGPRFTDWWGYDPLPVDADLLPAVVPGYRKPFRLLPYGVKPKLTDREMTVLRRLGRPLPCHFALGRNRNLQGLAASMLKLWERCEIAKIAVKRGVQNTNSEIMAEELKLLTGGTLLSRDREFIAFYRGKDFLPPAVSAAIEERKKYEIYKDRQKKNQSSSVDTMLDLELRSAEPASVDELKRANDQKKDQAMEQRKLNSASLAVKSMDSKLSVALEKKAKAEKLLEELEKAATTQRPEADREGITKEERYMLRKVGLRMKPFLLMGRRGVFAGTIENMHLHWKYRELVKIICNDRHIEEVQRAAQTLEAESGGILVAVERVSKGHAIIVYRGKNYQRPIHLRPRTLLNKREALKRSLEAQRRESLKLHVLELTKNIHKLKHQVVEGEAVKNSARATECEQSNAVFESSDHSVSVECAHCQENVEGRDMSLNSLAKYEDQFPEAEPESSSDAVLDEWSQGGTTCSVTDDEAHASGNELRESTSEPFRSKPDLSVHKDVIEGCDVEMAFGEAPPLNWGRVLDDPRGRTAFSVTDYKDNISTNELRQSSDESVENKPESSVRKDDMEGGSDVGVPFRAAPLSNRDRLILRKQALKMKKRPVLAIGRNNIITGVAKAIKTHFRKNRLAIVNIKGRAKGTSVQEVVLKLEQATGAMLVSQEPNKVILYRGWGEGEEGGGVTEKLDGRKRSTGGGVQRREVVSPELMAAIRLECGLQSSLEEEVPL